MLPTFLVVGAAKCGTTSVYHYLRQHPQIFMSPVLAPEEGYVDSHTRESRDADGRLIFITGKDRIKAISELPNYDFTAQRVIPLETLLSA